MNTLIIHPQQSLIDEIIPHLKSAEKDYSSNLVVFPGKRPSHFLRKAIAHQVKGSFIPPVIFSMDEFVDHLYEGVRSQRKLETVDAVAVLYEIQKKAESPFGGDNFLSPDSFFPIGLKIYRDMEELYIEGINPIMVKQIEPYTDEVIPEHTAKRLMSLSFFYEEFYKAIEGKGLSTRSLRYEKVAEKIDEAGLDAYEQIIFAGFFALTRCEKVMFRKLLNKENTLFIFQEGPGLKEKLSDIGIKNQCREDTHSCTPLPHSGGFAEVNNRGISSPHTASPKIHFYSSPDTHGQVYALSKVLEANLKEDGNGVEDPLTTAIVLPLAETLFPLLRQGLPHFDEDGYNISLGYPLHRTPIFGFLNNLLELITSMDEDRVYIPDYLKFVLHPYTKNIFYNGSAEITRIMFHAVEEQLTQNRTRTFITLEELEKDETILGHIVEKIPGSEKGISKTHIREHLKTIHHHTVENFLSFGNIKDFAKKCVELLVYVFHNSTAPRHPLFYPFSESFLKMMEAVSNSLMQDFAFRETVSYFTFFRKYIMTGYTPFEGTPLRGLQILGFLETRNIKFDRVFILNANEEVLPDTRRDDSILPFKARQILGLPTYIDRDRLAAYYFETLIKGASEAHIFFVENDNRERSRFVERLLWKKQKIDKTTDAKKYITPVRYKVRLDNPSPSEIPKTGRMVNFLRDFEYHATALDTYLDCQRRFYYAYVLNLERKEEISGDIERADIGKFVHRALAEYFKKRKGRLLKEKDICPEEMSLLGDKLFEEDYGKNLSGAAYLLRYQIKSHLKDVLKKYYLPLIVKERVTILNIERKITVSEGSFRLKGRLDSIERRGLKTCIIDYKTGSNADRLKINFNNLDPDSRDSFDKAIGSIQLPFYLVLYSKYTGVNVKDLNGLFLLLGRSVISKEIEIPLFEDGNEEKTFRMLKDIIFRLLGEITDPAYPFKPASDKKASCPDCDFKYICGTQWVV